MKKIYRFIISLLLCFILTSCNKATYIGNHYTTSIVSDTLMKLEINQMQYDIDEINVPLYLGFKDVTCSNEVTYGLYLANEYIPYEQEDKVFGTTSIVSDIKNINKYYYYLDSFSKQKAVEEYSYSLKRIGLKKYEIKYENYYNLHIPKKFLFNTLNDIKHDINNLDARLTIMIKVVAFEKVIGGYECSSTIDHQVIRVRCHINKDYVMLGAYNSSFGYL